MRGSFTDGPPPRARWATCRSGLVLAGDLVEHLTAFPAESDLMFVGVDGLEPRPLPNNGRRALALPTGSREIPGGIRT